MPEIEKIEVPEREKWLSLREVAKRLEVSRPTAWRYVSTGQLPAYRVGGQIRVRAVDCDRFPTVYEVRG